LLLFASRYINESIILPFRFSCKYELNLSSSTSSSSTSSSSLCSHFLISFQRKRAREADLAQKKLVKEQEREAREQEKEERRQQEVRKNQRERKREI